MSFKAALRLLCLGFVFGFAKTRADTLITFDNGNELTTLFSRNNSNLSQVSSGGVNNSGAVQVSGSSAEATYNASSFSFSQPGMTLSCSIFFQYQAVSQFWYPIQVGFLSSPNVVFDANANAMGVQVFSGSSGPVLYTDFGRTGYGASLTGLTVGNWYRLTGSFLNQSSNLRITASLDDFGVTGTTLVTNVDAINVTAAPSGNILGTPSVWLAFEGYSVAGVNRIDNLSVIPEPGPASLLVLAGGLLLLLAQPGVIAHRQD